MARVDRTERLLNLVICLMSAGTAVPRARIREGVNGYSDATSDSAFERMFERDKDELRGLGIPVETVIDSNGEVRGYRIDKTAYALPAAQWTLGERTALVLAAHTWAQALDGAEFVQAKLEPLVDTAGVEPNPAATISAGDAALIPLMRALREQSPVHFEYRGAKDDVPALRTTSPWGLALKDGRWFLTGFDHARVAQRTFRVSRISGAVTPADETFVSAPEGFDPSQGSYEADSDPVTARVEVSAGKGARLRAHATSIPDVGADIVDPAVEIIDVEFPSHTQLVSALLAAGPDARVLEPAHLRSEVIAGLQSVLHKHGATR